jgi:hypothetical protein
MASVSTNPKLPTSIRATLDRLRGQIQRYVLIQAAVLAIIVVLCIFWLAGFVDYFPVMMGASESPRWARAVMLTGLIAAMFWVLYRFGWRKWWVRWQDSSLALLLERRFPELQHSLITTVQAHQPKTGSTNVDLIQDPTLIAATQLQATSAVEHVDLEQVMRWEPLRSQLGILGGMLGLSLVVALWQPTWTMHWSKRLFALSNTAWPRSCRIEIEGLEINIPSFANEEQGQRYLRPFNDGEATLARGHSARLLVKADMTAKQTPEICMLSYRNRDGQQGRASLRRLIPRNSTTLPFMLEGPPLESVDQGLAMTLQGGDARIAGLRLKVVDAPQVNDLKLEVKYPAYLQKSPSATWLDETLDYRTGIRLPQGTQVSLVGQSNLPLDRCECKWTFSDRDGVSLSKQNSFPADGNRFRIPLDSPLSSTLIEIRLWDADGHCSTKIQQYFLNALLDEIPSVDLKLDGIGNAVTENALLPIDAKVQDDHGISHSWLELFMNEKVAWKRGIKLTKDGIVRDQIDFRSLRDSKELAIAAGQSVTLSMFAKDDFDLSPDERLGRASPIQLNIVTPSQLLLLLERRELAMRSRIELIISELNQLRELILKIRQTNRQATDPNRSPEPGDEKSTSESQSAEKLQLPRVQQSVTQVEKSAGELKGVEVEIGQIYRELVNNRVDSQDRQDRLENRVRIPLQKIREGSLNELQRRTKNLEKEIEKGPANDLTVAGSLDSLAETLTALEAILEAMIDIQDFNEVIDMVRSMVDDQGKLLDRTKAEQKQRLLDQFK